MDCRCCAKCIGNNVLPKHNGNIRSIYANHDMQTKKEENNFFLFLGGGEYLEKTVPLFEIAFSQISFNVYDLEFNKEKLLDIEQDINQRLMCKLSTCSN